MSSLAGWLCGERQTPALYDIPSGDDLLAQLELDASTSGHHEKSDDLGIVDDDESGQRLDDLRREIVDAKLDW